jgi:ATP-binding cassette, subfamily B, bacterial
MSESNPNKITNKSNQKANLSGLKCIQSISHHYGKLHSIASLRSKYIGSDSTNSLMNLAELAEKVGFRARNIEVTFDNLISQVPLPCIIKWPEKGFAIVKKVTDEKVEIQFENEVEIIATDEFCKIWYNENETGTLLLLDPTHEFFTEEEPLKADKPLGLRSLLVYLKKYPRLVWQLVISMVIGTLLKLIVPFLTQSIVDVGVMNNNLNFIYLFFAAQLMLMVSRNSLEAIRGWLLLYVSSRVGVSLLTDFIAKIMRLPVSYFNEKAVGEVMQRIEDQKRIEVFLSTNLSNILFSIINLCIYTAIFALYDFTIFAIFLGATLLYLGWISLFMKKRRAADYNRAKIAEQEQNKLVQMVQGMADIKLANAEMVKRWDWEQLRAKLFRQNIKLLKLSQIQQIGGLLINETKTLFITFLSAKAVLDGHLSLGAMLAVQQMLGQTATPTEQLFAFLQQIQDARISTERINAVHQLREEEEDNYTKINQLPESQPIVLRNVNFQYPNSTATVLRDVNLTIQNGKTTAIVGSSGSGKTTLLKLLIKHFEPTTGEVSLGNINLRNVSARTWRAECGVVMTDGVIFSDTIMQNIALGEEDPDVEMIMNAAKIANINEWIESTAMGFYTKIGDEYGAISQGQKQRLLIARAVYKNPDYLFFDEGTSALDAQNQQVILKNLNEFFKNRTTVVVAHRLSTIKNADQIVVIEEGQISEKGTHLELIDKKGRYFELLTTQLEAAS